MRISGGKGISSKTFLITKTDFLTQKLKGAITSEHIKNLLKLQNLFFC
jgi:hypothetical protein